MENKKNPMESSEKLYKASEPKPNTKCGKLRFAPAVVFVFFIFALAIWFIVNPKLDYSPAEKRYLQDFPEANVDNVLSGKFGADFEKYFADHFPARQTWVGFNAYYTLSTGVNGQNGVYNCDDDYLINKPVDTENKVERNVNTLVNFKKKIGNTPMTVMFAPSTGYVANEKLPLIHDSYNDDQYFNVSKKKLSDNGVDFVDLRDTFKQKYADGEQLYYRTDHHWTTLGAYEAYVKLCEQLGTQPVPRGTFVVQSYEGFYGTTYSTSGFWLTKPDSIQIYNNPKNTEKNITLKIVEGKKEEEYHSMYFYDHLNDDDKYPVFIDGNHAYTEICNSNAKGGTVLLIKDSFSHCMAPFLAENYSRVILIDPRYYKLSVSKLVEQTKPEHVIALYGIDNIATDTDIAWLQ